jgi:hypothetical protein
MTGAIPVAARGEFAQNRAMDSLPPPLPPAYQDRRTGLLVFGILSILLGAFFALSVPMSVFGMIVGSRQLAQPVSWAQGLPSMVQMMVLATALISLGIGSIKARRWARALMLCGGWIGLVAGVISCAMLPWMLGSMRVAMEQQPGMEQLPPAFLQIMMIVIGVMVGVFYVAIPLAVVLFYRSPHVKLTCEARDPVERWTDRCPLPVLAAVLVLGYTAFAILTVLPQFRGAFLFFGTILTGAPALALWAVLLGVMVWAAIGFHRLDLRAWWGYVVLMIFFGINLLVSFSRVSLLDFYRAAGMSDGQLALVEKMPFAQGGAVWAMMLPSGVLLLGYLVYLHRYFVRRPPAAGG